jgi:hypothetical protein
MNTPKAKVMSTGCQLNSFPVSLAPAAVGVGCVLTPPRYACADIHEEEHIVHADVQMVIRGTYTQLHTQTILHSQGSMLVYAILKSHALRMCAGAAAPMEPAHTWTQWPTTMRRASIRHRASQEM